MTIDTEIITELRSRYHIPDDTIRDAYDLVTATSYATALYDHGSRVPVAPSQDAICVPRTRFDAHASHYNHRTFVIVRPRAANPRRRCICDACQRGDVCVHRVAAWIHVQRDLLDH